MILFEVIVNLSQKQIPCIGFHTTRHLAWHLTCRLQDYPEEDIAIHLPLPHLSTGISDLAESLAEVMFKSS